GKKNMIVALGGGAILDPDNVKLLTKLGTLVYLQVDKSILKERLLKGPIPVYLDSKDPEASFEKMYEKRKEAYESVPSIWLDANREEEKVLEDLISIVHGK
ncbi:MAG TPA: shikimate kinase, partial [Chlamydiales bacterium]|nr:shikimate kinase [Chlamydiales bacterium]